MPAPPNTRPRVFLHVDMNAYFATLEQQANPRLRNTPIGIVGSLTGGRSVVVAASYEAKRAGFENGMTMTETKALCPDIQFIVGDPDKYRWTHNTLTDIFERVTPSVDVFSIDESFLDITGSMHLFHGPRNAAQHIKRDIRHILGDHVTCSIGIAPTKLLAKLVSGLKKPDGLVHITWDDISTLFRQTPIEALCGIGRRLSPTLHRLRIHTAADLCAYPRTELQKIFGPRMGYNLHRMGHGLDPLLHTHPSPLPQSVSHTYTTPHDVVTTADAKKVLYKLSEQVGNRMRRAGLTGSRVAASFEHTAVTTHLPRPTNDGYRIFRSAWARLAITPFRSGFRHAGVMVSGIRQGHGQRSLFQSPRGKHEEFLTQQIGKIRDRYGDWTILRGLFLESPTDRTARGNRPHPYFLPPVGGFVERTARFEKT